MTRRSERPIVCDKEVETMVRWKVLWPEDLEGSSAVAVQASAIADDAENPPRPVLAGRPRLRLVGEAVGTAPSDAHGGSERSHNDAGDVTTDESDRHDIRPYARAVMIRERARDIYHNRVCPACRRAAAVPLCLQDGTRDPSGRVNPFTATLVGFRCLQCRHEWPASRIHH
ncbi:MAG: hypothetical protein D6725_15010 [Planctomycetota bacterium]|nr:MAG: hypothetical protein D6725_15010 [Planctomycetota bacterium]